jgi:hypothetical protein
MYGQFTNHEKLYIVKDLQNLSVKRRIRMSEQPDLKNDMPDDDEEDTYLNVGKLFTFASLANYAAWILLIGYIIAWIASILNFIAGNRSITLVIFLSSLPSALQGIFYFVVLRFISEAVYLGLEIAENTQNRS